MKSINESVLLATKQFLGEMFIEGQRNFRSPCFVLAYRSKIWLFPDTEALEIASKRILNSIKKETQAKTALQSRDSLQNRPDIFQAMYRKTNKRAELSLIRGLNFQLDMHASPLVQKVAKALNATVVSTSDENGNHLATTQTKELKLATPSWGYHGTSSRHLMGILKNGLMPKPEQTNFVSVVHRDTIFLTTDPVKALFHAQNAVPEQVSRRGSRDRHQDAHKRNSAGHHVAQPVILKVKIPDPDLITADFDIDRESAQTTYNKMYDRDMSDRKFMPGNPVKLSKNVGVFGYTGRILPQMITEVHIGAKREDFYGDESFNDTDGFDPAHVRKWLQRLQEIDEDSVGEVDLKDYLNNPEEFLQELSQKEDDEDA